MPGSARTAGRTIRRGWSPPRTQRGAEHVLHADVVHLAVVDDAHRLPACRHAPPRLRRRRSRAPHQRRGSFDRRMNRITCIQELEVRAHDRVVADRARAPPTSAPPSTPHASSTPSVAPKMSSVPLQPDGRHQRRAHAGERVLPVAERLADVPVSPAKSAHTPLA